MKNDDSTNLIIFFAALLQVVVYGGIGAAITYWLFDNVTIGAIFGVGIYQALGMALIGQDVMEIKKNMKVRKKGG